MRIKLLLEALVALAVTRLRLPACNWDSAQPDAAKNVGAARRSACATTEVAWAVRVASRIAPGTTCLVQALAAQTMLARRGHPSRLRIGVAAGQRFEAHAWLECGDEVLIGGSGVERYHVLL